MKIAGFADEASSDIREQIKVTRELGWAGIEMRMIGPKLHFDDADEKTFDAVRRLLDEAGIRIICYGSQIANWARPVTNDFRVDMEELKRIVPRMKKTGTPFARIMSYPNAGLSPADWRKEVLRRLRDLAKAAEDGGIILCHENCNGWAGEGPRETLEMLSEIGSPALKLIFDTGNPVAHHQNALDYYQAVKAHVVHIHIKDYVLENGKDRAVFPGEGDGFVKAIVADLKKSGYDGWYTIEPHLSKAIHLGQTTDKDPSAKNSYLEYGRRFEALFRAA